MNLTELANSIAALNKRIPIKANEKAVEVATTILRDLTQVTPVDTGEALSNWQVTVDTPAENIRESYAPSPRGRWKNGQWVHSVPPEITREANAPMTEGAARAVLASRQNGQPIFITNLVEHVQYLDQGTSDQQPAGFIDRAIILGREIIDKIRFSL